MAVKFSDMMDLMSSKSGDELFWKITGLLDRFGITTTNDDGTVKDLRTLCDEVIETKKKGGVM